MDSSSPYDKSNERAVAEDELLALGGCILNLAGLYGGERQPRNWVSRVAKSKEDVKGKGALHLVHGEDVARGVIAVHEAFEAVDETVRGIRYMVTDLHVYDWWDLIWTWASEKKGKEEGDREDKLEYVKWVAELMVEEGVKALPRNEENLGRRLDGREFWQRMGILPAIGRVT